eukprot:16393983-Heterocapsa_arctica.AAC.1
MEDSARRKHWYGKWQPEHILTAASVMNWSNTKWQQKQRFTLDATAQWYTRPTQNWCRQMEAYLPAVELQCIT